MDKTNSRNVLINREGDRTTFSISFKKRPGVYLFSGLWFFCILSFAGNLSKISEVTLEDSNFFLWIYCTFLILAGLPVTFLLLRNLFGLERISIYSSFVELETTLFKMGRQSKYEIRKMNNLRFKPVNKGNPINRMLSFWGLSKGRIFFEYGKKTLSFGTDLNCNEANLIILELDSRIET